LYQKKNSFEISPNVATNGVSSNDVSSNEVSSNDVSPNNISAENDLVAESFEEKEMSDKSNLFRCKFRYFDFVYSLK